MTMGRILAVVAVVAGCVLCRAYEDHFTQSSQALGNKVHEVPLELGDWVGVEQQMEQRAVKGAQLTGWMARGYKQLGTGREVNVLVVWGRPSAVTTHTPDQCYTSQGYKMSGKEARESLAVPGLDEKAEFYVGDFRKDEGPIAERLRICWTWTSHGEWAAPDEPDHFYGRHRTWYTYGGSGLFKVYFVEVLNPTAEAEPGIAPCADFIRLFLPELQKQLFPAG
jgi:hypothetical protein